MTIVRRLAVGVDRCEWLPGVSMTLSSDNIPAAHDADQATSPEAEPAQIDRADGRFGRVKRALLMLPRFRAWHPGPNREALHDIEVAGDDLPVDQPADAN